MLRQLYIRNFALIDRLDITFGPGFSVITGETGAGKSIILGALGLLTGRRVEGKPVKNGEERCVIEAHFDLSRYRLEDFFQENDIDYVADDCILRREISQTGRSRAFVNDTPVQLSLMRELGDRLVDIHSQHQNLLLGKEDFQIEVVDIIAGDKDQLADYRQAYLAWNEARRDCERLKNEMAEARRQEDFLKFQLKELEEASLEEGMQEALEQEAGMLGHTEDIKQALFATDNLLGGDGDGVVIRLKSALQQIASIAEVWPAAKDWQDRLESASVELKDLAGEISRAMEDVEYDPARLEQVNARLDRLYDLEKKYTVSDVSSLISIRDDIRSKVGTLDNSEDILREKEEEERRLEAKAQDKAATLTRLRTKAARKVEQELQERLAPLGIPHVRFQVEMGVKPLAGDGQDKMQFLFSANSSSPLQPISQVASGGEIARVMLSLKAMVSGAVKLPTIIFDEIDTGVSGKIAGKMADIMREMGKADRQVISITHLPQIAAAGEAHYLVVKEETPQGTVSSMRRLTDDERLTEIARMLSGSEVTEAAVNNARELINAQS